jgi:hypothetical protein
MENKKEVKIKNRLEAQEIVKAEFNAFTKNNPDKDLQAKHKSHKDKLRFLIKWDNELDEKVFDQLSYFIFGGKDKKDDNEIYVSFLIHPKTGMIAEEVYKDGVAKFAVWDGRYVTYHEKIDIEGIEGSPPKTYFPLVNKALEIKAIRLPTEAAEYESTLTLIDEIQAHIHKWVDISEGFEKFASWYVLLSYLYDKVHNLPYLRFLGDIGTGKSRAQDTIGGLCYKSFTVSGAVTPAPIYRLISQWKGTIILDEADWKDSGEKAEVIKILNSGFETNRFVIRCAGENHEVDYHFTYGPKILGTRKNFEDQALESRCLTEQMVQTDRQDIPLQLNNVFYEEQASLRNKLLMYRFKNYNSIDFDKASEFDLGDIEPRLKQTCMSFVPLFVGTDLEFKFREFLFLKNKEMIEDRAESFDGKVVQALFALHESDAMVESENITPKAIAEKMEELFKKDFEKGVSSAKVGRTLKSLNIKNPRSSLLSRRQRYVVWDDKLLNKIKKRYLGSTE